MRFYTKSHQSYCGVDLHARTMYVCILNQPEFGIRSCCKIPHANRFNSSRIMLIWIIAALLTVNRS